MILHRGEIRLAQQAPGVLDLFLTLDFLHTDIGNY
jgi:hypothetical protein